MNLFPKANGPDEGESPGSISRENHPPPILGKNLDGVIFIFHLVLALHLYEMVNIATEMVHKRIALCTDYVLIMIMFITVAAVIIIRI